MAAAKAAQYPGHVIHLRRDKGGQGKAHTLNHGLAIVLGDEWMEALLITDADVIFEPDSLARWPGTWLTREWVPSPPTSRRAAARATT